MTRADKIGLALCLVVPGGIFVAGAVWLYRRIRERNRVVVREPAATIDFVTLSEARSRANGEDWWN
jgi:hypothetical protein